MLFLRNGANSTKLALSSLSIMLNIAMCVNKYILGGEALVTLPEKYVVLPEKYVAGLVTLPEKYVVLPEKYVAGLVTLPEKYVVLSKKYIADLVCQNND